MVKGSEKLARARREEIINACAKLYKSKSFSDITIRDIGAATTFSRTSVYNYFQTKEEIFLALLEREYAGWAAALEAAAQRDQVLTRDEFAQYVAQSLQERELMLSLLTMNLTEMETNSRPEQLAQFKTTYYRLVSALEACLARFFPGMTAEERSGFIQVFLSFLFGIYPTTHVTEKQKQAIADVGAEYVPISVHDLTYSCVRQLLAH